MYRMIGSDGREYGPFSTQELQQHLREGRAMLQTMVCADGSSEWRPLSTFPELSGMSSVAIPAIEPTGIPRIAPPSSVPYAPKTNGMAVAGLIMGILSVVTLYCGFLFSLLGIIFSSVAITQINKEPTMQGGKGMAMAGLILSLVGIVISTLLLIFFAALGTMA